LVGTVDFRGTRGNFLGGESPDAVTQHFDFFAERELQTGQVAHCCVSRVRWRPVGLVGAGGSARAGGRRRLASPLPSRTRRDKFQCAFHARLT
jgi:hypothetical protein